MYARFNVLDFTFSFKAVLNQFEIYVGGGIMYLRSFRSCISYTSKFGLSDHRYFGFYTFCCPLV